MQHLELHAGSRLDHQHHCQTQPIISGWSSIRAHGSQGDSGAAVARGRDRYESTTAAVVVVVVVVVATVTTIVVIVATATVAKLASKQTRYLRHQLQPIVFGY